MLGDAGGAIQGAGQLYRDGFAARTVVEGLVAAFGLALHAELGLGGEKMDGADVPRLLKLQAALDEQDSRFARSADGLSLELALTHALLAADAGSGGTASASAGRTQTPAAAVPADVTQRLNRLEKELATLKAGGMRAAASGPAAAVADFDPGARQSVGGRGNGPAPVREAVNAALEDLEEAAPAALPAAAQGSWAELTRQASMQLRAFLKPARTHAEAGFVSLTYDDKNAFHAKQVVSKYDELAALVLRVFGPVAFELVTPEGTKRQKMGAGAVALAAPSPAPARAKAAVSTPPASTPTPASIPPASEVPAFQPTRTQRPATTPASSNPASSSRGPEFAPIDTAPVASKPAQNGAAQPAPRAAPVATIEPPAARVHQRSSPDDVAAAPLPTPTPAPWEAEHAADAPPAPADAGGGDRITPVGASRELYIVEAITEEPDWGDVGGEFQASTASGPPTQGGTAQSSATLPPLDDAPYASFMPERPAPTPRPEPVAPPAPKLTPPEPKATALKAASGRPADIRAHPMYEEIKGRFSGRVREIGKNRNPAPVVAETDGDDEDVGEV
jgi:DNA polymerase-3 subunit gamma/tau